MWNKIRCLIWKELLAVLRDRKVRISILVPPIMQLFLFTFAATLDVKNVTIGILNLDYGQPAWELTQRFYSSNIFKHVIFLKGNEEIAPFLDSQQGLAVLSIDEQFSRDFIAQKPTHLQLILDGRRSNTAQIVAGYVSNILAQFQVDYADQNSPFRHILLINRVWFNPNRLYYWYNIPCLVGVLSMLTCLVVTTQSVARERELGTFDQLLVSPLLPGEILIGKIVPGIVVGMIEGLLMLCAGIFLLHVPFTGNFFIYFLSLTVFVTSISGVGLFISSLAATQQQAMLGTFVFMIPSVLLSGFGTPIENMPTWLQPVTMLIPLKYMLIISKGLFLKAMPSSIVLNNLWQMIIIGVMTLGGASWFFRKRLE